MQTKTDAELLEAYASKRDNVAFGELMRRHTAMVYHACYRLLKDACEAEDASQAVFLVLARKADRLRKDNLSAWLYRVAHLVAAETVRKRMRRVSREETYAREETIQGGDFTSDEIVDTTVVLGMLDSALLGLPEPYREAVILRYLQNYSQEDAAQLAGCPLGTMKRRASEGIAKLRQRLAKRGVALGGVALAGLLTSEAAAAVPETLIPTILATVKTVAAGAATTGASTTAAMLAKGAMKAMYLAKVKMVAAVAAAVMVTGTAVPVGIAVAQAVGKDEAPKTNTASVVDDATAMYLRAVAQMRAKDYKAAIQTLETLLQTYPEAKTIRPEALYWLGDGYSRVKDPAAAKRVWEKLNSEFPESNWGKYGRGRLSADNGFITLSPRPDYEVPDYPTNSLPEAEATLQGEADKRFAKKEPKEYELAAVAYDSFVLKYPKSKAVPYAMVRKGRSLQFVGKRSEAIKIYGGVVENYPDSISNAAPVLLYLAQCHYLDKNVKESTKAIAQLRADKDYGKHEAAACATFLLAHMQAEGGRTDEAIATLGTIAAPFPAYAALAQLRQAEVYEKAGRMAEAVAAYRATLKKYPGTPEATLAHSALDKMGNRVPDGEHAEP
jgi:RNA polymerase sigma factor (sigma-70 family)